MSKTKVLFLAANPIKKNILSLDEEIRAITEKIRMSEHRDSLDLISAWAVRPDDLLQTLNQHKPQVVHFSGHGTPDGQIMLVGKNGKPTPVTARTLQDLFTTLKDNIQLVVLNACYSEIQARAITRVIDCAIGMNAPVGDNAAILFAASLYRAIGFGRSIEDAFKQGKLAVSLNDLEGENTPELIPRRGVKPAHIILVNEPQEPVEIKRDRTFGITFASTFLSHSSSDRPLVEAVARELGRRGILAWLDTNELQAGATLSDALTMAIKEQVTVTAFLSPEALKSDWVDHELKVALKKEEELNANDLVMPVYLGDIDSLVSGQNRLRKRWLYGIRKRVDRFGVVSQDSGDMAVRAKEIASKIADAIYRRLRMEQAAEVVIYVDQRGKGPRRGKPDIPAELLKLDAPALVFRPDLALRSDVETVFGLEWEELSDTMKTALAVAVPHLTSQRPRKIHLAGHAQLGFAYLIGHHFERTTNTELHCIGLRETFTNEGQSRDSPLSGGNPHCESEYPGIGPLPDQPPVEAISLLLCKQKDEYIEEVLRYLGALKPSSASLWVKHEVPLTSSQQVMSYVANVVALLGRLKRRGLRRVHLYTTLPFHAVPLLAANLKKYVVDELVFMEYRSDLQGANAEPGELYTPLRF